MWRLVCILALVRSLNAGSETPRQVVAIDINGIVHPITVERIAHALNQARQQNAALVLVRINTPGGMLDAARENRGEG